MRHNQHERSLDPSAWANLGELIDEFTREAEGGSQIVTSVRVNGCAIPDHRLSELDVYPMDGIQDVEVASAPSRQLALSSIANSSDYASSVRAALERAVDLFRTGEIERGSDLCAALADSFGVLVAAVSAASAALGSEAEELRDLDRELLPWIESLVDAQSDRDWVRVADCLAYEVGPVLEGWESKLQRCSRRLAQEEESHVCS